MKNYVLRLATEKDEKNICNLIHRANKKQFVMNTMGITWKRFLIAETMDGEFIGCGKMKRHFDGCNELGSVVVEEKYRKMGIAKDIINHLLSESERPIYGICASNMAPYYNQFGFRIAKRSDLTPYFKIARTLQKIVFPIKEKRLMIMTID